MFTRILISIALFSIVACDSQPKNESVQSADEQPKVLVGDAAKGKELFRPCVQCHGDKAQGLSEKNAPTLAAQEPWYLSRQLANFKAGIRGTHKLDTFGLQMQPMSLSLPDEQAIADVVAFINSNTYVPNIHKTKGDIVVGKEYYDMTCGSCHGTAGSGLESLNSPKLTGLPDWYLIRQVQHFRSGIRGSHPNDKYGAQMSQIANTFQDDKMLADVVAYINSVE